MFNLPPPPGFQGLHPDKPLHVHHRHLPHWRQQGATYFVTFRLADSLPQEKLRELDALRVEWKRRHCPGGEDEDGERLAREIVEKVEKWLDQGMGRCWLRETRFSAVVTEALHHFDEDRYQLGAYVVMPNHVHLVVRPLLPERDALEDILHSWKRYTSRLINKCLGQSGVLWQEESFDRIVRDEEHLYRVLQYIGRNSAQAGLSTEACPLWLRPEWERLGWRFESLV